MRVVVVVVLVALVTLVASHPGRATPSGSTSTPGTTAAPAASFLRQMDMLAGVLGALLPDALNQGPVDAARAQRLRDGVGALQGVAHDLGAMSASLLPDADPSLGLLLTELNRAVDDVDRSRPDRLPQTALSLASTCIACHTRTAGRAAPPGLADVDAALPADVRADILTATRRFPEARAAWRDVVFDEDFARNERWRWERAVRRALAVEVRVASDARGAARLVEQVLATPGADVLYTAASAWRADVAAWRAETAPEAPYAQAARLMNEVVRRHTPAGDASDDIVLLRATSTLHALLATAPATLTPTARAQALAWLGIAYERLTDLDVWGVFLFYDAACVEAAPHTALASSCLARFERAALELYAGNAGGPLPSDIARRLQHLRSLAR
jgi:mono/diheme cytochrome c family protein